MKIPGVSPITVADGWFAGEDQTLQWTIYDADQAAKDITGWTIEFRMATTKGGASVLTKSATLLSPTAGICQVAVVGADTSGLQTATPYFYSLSRTDAGNNQVLASGRANLQARPV